MHFLLADEASIPAPIASIAKIPFFFNSLLIGIHSCGLALALLELLLLKWLVCCPDAVPEKWGNVVPEPSWCRGEHVCGFVGTWGRFR